MPPESDIADSELDRIFSTHTATDPISRQKEFDLITQGMPTAEIGPFPLHSTEAALYGRALQGDPAAAARLEALLSQARAISGAADTMTPAGLMTAGALPGTGNLLAGMSVPYSSKIARTVQDDPQATWGEKVGARTNVLLDLVGAGTGMKLPLLTGSILYDRAIYDRLLKQGNKLRGKDVAAGLQELHQRQMLPLQHGGDLSLLRSRGDFKELYNRIKDIWQRTGAFAHPKLPYIGMAEVGGEETAKFKMADFKEVLQRAIFLKDAYENKGLYKYLPEVGNAAVRDPSILPDWNMATDVAAYGEVKNPLLSKYVFFANPNMKPPFPGPKAYGPIDYSWVFSHEAPGHGAQIASGVIDKLEYLRKNPALGYEGAIYTHAKKVNQKLFDTFNTEKKAGLTPLDFYDWLDNQKLLNPYLSREQIQRHIEKSWEAQNLGKIASVGGNPAYLQEPAEALANLVAARRNYTDEMRNAIFPLDDMQLGWEHMVNPTMGAAYRPAISGQIPNLTLQSLPQNIPPFP